METLSPKKLPPDWRASPPGPADDAARRPMGEGSAFRRAGSAERDSAGGEKFPAQPGPPEFRHCAGTRRSNSLSTIASSVVRRSAVNPDDKPRPARRRWYRRRRARWRCSRPGARVERMADSRSSLGSQTGLFNLGLLAVFPIVVGREGVPVAIVQLEGRILQCARRRRTAVRLGPIARTRTVASPPPSVPTMNPPIMTLSPVSTKPRVEMLASRARR